jgi:competence protein ComEC
VRLAVAALPGPADRTRAALAARIAAATDGRGALLRALLLGDRTALTAGHWRALALGGTTHLFVVSGLHVALVAALVAGVLRLAGRGPATAVGAAGATLAAGAYVLLSGAGLPAQRAFAMLVVALAASVGDRAPRAVAALGWAASVVLVLDPRAVLDLGLWLSLLAVAALVAGSGRRRSSLRTVAGVQLRITAVLTVPLVAAFGWLPLAAPAVNLAAVPVVAVLVLPAGLIALAGLVVGVPGAEAVLGVLERTLGEILEAAAAIGTPVTPASPPALVGLLALAAVAAAVLPLPPALRAAALCLALGLVAVPPPAPAPGQFRVHVLDVGQGLSVLVRTRRHAVVLDAGPRFLEDGPDAGALLVAPALRALGVHRVDELLVSHGDADHAGGVPGLRRALPVARVRGPPTIAGRSGACRAPLRLQLDGVRLTVLHPGPEADAGADNRRSCVLLVRGATARVLLPADIDRWVERRLAPRIGPVDLVVAPHHGSRSSSGRALVRHLRPAAVVFPAGAPSAFGHPHADVVARWRAIGARTVVTGEAGMVSWDSARPRALRCWRATRDGWWRARRTPADCD